jgi:hypothetical protein
MILLVRLSKAWRSKHIGRMPSLLHGFGGSLPSRRGWRSTLFSISTKSLTTRPRISDRIARLFASCEWERLGPEIALSMLVDTDNNFALIGQTPTSSLGIRLSIDNKDGSVFVDLVLAIEITQFSF